MSKKYWLDGDDCDNAPVYEVLRAICWVAADTGIENIGKINSIKNIDITDDIIRKHIFFVLFIL